MCIFEQVVHFHVAMRSRAVGQLVSRTSYRNDYQLVNLLPSTKESMNSQRVAVRNFRIGLALLLPSLPSWWKSTPEQYIQFKALYLAAH